MMKEEETNKKSVYMINFWKIYEIVKDAIRKDRIHRNRMLLRYIKSFKNGIITSKKFVPIPDSQES
jgi:hypothetical protein